MSPLDEESLGKLIAKLVNEKFAAEEPAWREALIPLATKSDVDAVVAKKDVEIAQLEEDLATLVDDVAKKDVEIAQLEKDLTTVIEANRTEATDRAKAAENYVLTTFKQFEDTLAETNTSITDNTETLLAELHTTLTKENSHLVNQEVRSVIDALDQLKTTVLDHQVKTLERLSEAKDQIPELIEVVAQEATETFDQCVGKMQLEQKLYLQDELLRLNSHVNNKLDTLKGDKGDAGERGEKGDDGFLTGVSRWETGVITKMHQAVSHENGLWLCLCEASANEPTPDNEDYQLIVDGIKSIAIQNSQLTVTRTSGIEDVLGKTMVEVKGPFQKDTTYDRLDIVTLNKQSWISRKENNTDHPPGNGAWMLLAGKGIKGEQGKQGVQGEPANFDDIIPIINSAIEAKE